jgi:hypothetical protein
VLEILGFASFLLKTYPAQLARKSVPIRPKKGGEKAQKHPPEIIKVENVMFNAQQTSLASAKRLHWDFERSK